MIAIQEAKPQAGLLIEFALDSDGGLVGPHEAQKGESYFCPECHSPLVFRKGEVMRPHFAHAVDTNCSGESVIHIAAKMKIKQAIDRHIERPSHDVDLYWRCPGCDGSATVTLKRDASGCEIEHLVETGHRIDVAVVKGSKPVLCIEVLNTHKVDEAKARALRDGGYFWIEVNAIDAIQYPQILVAVNSNLPECSDCRNRKRIVEDYLPKAIERLPQRDSIQWHGSLSPLPVACRKCKTHFLAFRWESDLEPDGRPPNPVPWTVSYDYLQSLGARAWVNHCPKCYSILGPTWIDDAHEKWIALIARGEKTCRGS